MQIARSEAQMIVVGLEGAVGRIRKLEDSKSLTPAERKALATTLTLAEQTLAEARTLFRGAGISV